MEDYTASDERPLEKCLADVAESDIYIGIFALRYGFVPEHDNPEKLSITELELREAQRLRKPCLIFLLDEGVAWPPLDTDAYSGEGDRGEKIKALRARLNLDHNRTLFKSPEDLAASVSSSVANLLERRGRGGKDPRTDKPAAGALPREITFDVLLTHTELDAPFVADLADYLNSRRLRVALDPRSLFATSSDDFEHLDRVVRSCHSAAVLVSDSSLRQLEDRRQSVARVFRVLEARTRQLFAACLSDDSANAMAQWPMPRIENVVGWRPREASAPRGLHEVLEGLRLNTGLDSRRQWVGLPVIVVAMTRQEMDELDARPDIVGEKLGQAAHERFLELRAAVQGTGEPNAAKYGARREDCRPFSGSARTIDALLDSIVERINENHPSQLHGRLIKLQHYPFDELIQDRESLGPIFTQLLSTGCVVIVDEYSLLHPEIQEAVLSSGLLANDQVSLVTLSPANPYSTRPFDLLEIELRRRMAAAFNRFASGYDPQCELSIGDEQRLRRWLNSSLPHTIQTLRDPKPNRHVISQFAREQGLDPRPKIGTLLYSEGGPL
jgi:hypothetical protein